MLCAFTSPALKARHGFWMFSLCSPRSPSLNCRLRAPACSAASPARLAAWASNKAQHPGTSSFCHNTSMLKGQLSQNLPVSLPSPLPSFGVPLIRFGAVCHLHPMLQKDHFHPSSPGKRSTPAAGGSCRRGEAARGMPPHAKVSKQTAARHSRCGSHRALSGNGVL